MKKLTAILLIAALTLALTGCGETDPVANPNADNRTTSTAPEVTTPKEEISTLGGNMLEQEQQRYAETVNAITSANEISSVEIRMFSEHDRQISTPGGRHDDKAIIQKALDLLNKMSVTAVEYNSSIDNATLSSNDVFYSLSFRIGDKDIGVWCAFNNGMIYIERENSERIMLKVDNFSEIKSEFEELLREFNLLPLDELQDNLKTHWENYDKTINEIISADSVDKVKLTRFIPPQEWVSTETTDAETVRKWVDFIKNANVIAVPYNVPPGLGSGELTFYTDGKPLVVGNFMKNMIYSSDRETMLIITNYDELESLFSELEKQILGDANS
jgi:predicted small lipoprotein YifL